MASLALAPRRVDGRPSQAEVDEVYQEWLASVAHHCRANLSARLGILNDSTNGAGLRDEIELSNIEGP